jgi:hypothetical protein
MSRSSRSLMDEVLDSKEEQFVSIPGKRKSASMRNLNLSDDHAKNQEGDDAVNLKESLHLGIDGSFRNAKVQRRCHSVLASYGMRSSPSIPLAAFSIAGGIQEDSSPAEGNAVTSTEDEFENDDITAIVPPFCLHNEGNSTFEENRNIFSEPVLGLPKLRRSTAIRDPVALAESIEAIRESLRELGDDQYLHG